MPMKIKGRNGGTLTPPKKGEPSPNPKGRPKHPRALKDFIKQMENEDDEILLETTAIEIVEKHGKTFYKLKNSKGAKLFLSMYNQANKGNVKALDILIKLGFAGGYEPIKTQNNNFNREIKITKTIKKK